MKKRKASIKRSKVFQIALKGEGNGSFAGSALTIHCFCHAKYNIQ